eukprot:scaffold2584_cov141-Skeletonema_menzelii.AAC.3
MYAPSPNNLTHSSPEDSDSYDGGSKGSLLPSSFFNRLGSHGDVRAAADMSPPLMMSSGGLNVNSVQQPGGQNEVKIRAMTSTFNNMNSKASPFFQESVSCGVGGGGYATSAPFAPFTVAAAALGPSSEGSTLSNISQQQQQQQQQQGYGQLQAQYGYGIHSPPEHLASGGLINSAFAATAASGLGTSDPKSTTSVMPSSNHMGQSGHDASTTSNNSGYQQDEDLGRRQYEEIMSTPTLSTNGHSQDMSRMSIGGGGGDQNQQWTTNSGTTSTTTVPVDVASSSVQQQRRNNEGGGEDTALLPVVAPTVTSSSLWTNNNTKDGGDPKQPMVFHGKGSFPLNLALMLESVEHPWPSDNGSDGGKMNHIVSWLPCGTGFVIHQPDLFLSEVLPRFFKSSQNTKLRSFYRKLNRWGFSVLRSSHLDHEGTISSVKNAWKHPDFSRERAVECLVRAQKSGDTDYSQMMSVTHVSFGEGGSDGGRGTPGTSGGGGKKRGSKRFSDYSIDSTCSRGTMDADDTMDEFNSSFPTLDSNLSNKRRGSFRAQRRSFPAQRMSWTEGAGVSGIGPSVLNDAINLSWTAGINPVPNAAVSAQQLFQLNQSWTAGSNPLSTSTQPANWATPGFATNNASQLSHVQFNQSWNDATVTNNNSDDYNEWKNLIMQSNGHSGGSIFGQEHKAPASTTNSNSQEQQQQQQWSPLHQNQLGQLNGSQQQQLPQSNEEGLRHQKQDEGLTQEDIDLRTFFERFAERIGNDDEK